MVSVGWRDGERNSVEDASMKAGSSLLRNTLALSVPNAINPFLSFILVLVISRRLGAEGLGEYSLLLSFSLIFTTISSLGLGSLVVREVSREPEHVHAFFVNSMGFGFVSSIVGLVVMNLVIHVMNYDAAVVLGAFFCSLALIPGTAIRYMESIFRGLERSEFVAAGFAFENGLRVLVCVPLVLLGYGIVAIFAVITIIRLLGFFLLYYFYVKINGRPGWSFRPDIWGHLTREAPTFAGIAIFSTLHLNMCEVMLSKLQSIEAVGIFSAAGRIINMCQTLPLGFSLAVLPFLTKKSGEGKRDLFRGSVDSLRYVFIGVCPMVVGAFVLGDQIIELVYGAKFVSAGPVLRYLAFVMLPYTMVLILAQLLIATNNQRVDLMINISAVALSFVFNYAFIPRLGELGAVLAAFLTLVILNHLQYLSIKKLLFEMPLLRILWKPAAASMAMGVVTYFMQGWHLFLNIGVSACLYVVFVMLFRIFTQDELIRLRKAVHFGI